MTPEEDLAFIKKTKALFEKKGHKLKKEGYKPMVSRRSAGMFIYEQCLKCNISIYLWSQNLMPPCKEAVE